MAIEFFECPHCGRRSVAGASDRLRLLQSAGHLKRMKDPASPLIPELLKTFLPTIACSQCNKVGLRIVAHKEDFDDTWFGVQPKCESCKSEISKERLEIFPNAKLCVKCQGKTESNPADSNQTEDSCPKCGQWLVTSRRRSSVQAFAVHCPGCGYAPRH